MPVNVNVSIVLQHERIDVSRKYPTTTLPFQLEKKFYMVANKSQTSGGREGESRWYFSRANGVKELILGLVCNAISSLSRQQE